MVQRRELVSLLLCIAFACVMAELPLLETALESKGGSSVPPCSSVGFSFVVPTRNTTRFMFAIELAPSTAATWTMQLTRDNPESSFGLSDACAIDTLTQASNGPLQSLVLVKSCGLLEGKWYVLVKSTSPTVASFGFKPIVYKGSSQFSHSHCPDLPAIPKLPISADSQERVSAIGKKDTFPSFSEVLERYDFFQISIPAAKEIPKGSPMIIDIAA